jgi:hypothetical protein
MDILDLERKLGIDGMSADEQMALIVALQKSAEEKATQAREETIGKSADLVIQGLKRIKSDIETRFSELNSAIQTKTSSLKSGNDGKDGRDGKDGKSGRDGAKGDKGDAGRDGVNGIDGVDGISVVNANIDFDGSLVVTLSDGRELNVGEVVSPDIAEKIKVISTMSTNGAVAILDEGTSITSGVKKINFVGATVTATNSGDDVTVNVSAGTGTVTSVAATVPSFLSVSGSPVTTNGTLAITLSGTALPIANGGTGATTLTGASIATYTGTETLTNKRIDPRVTSAASASSLTPSVATADVYAYTALAASLTINAPTGTPVDGDKLMFRLLDNGTPQTLTWHATYTVIGVTLPTTTTASKTTYVGCIYNANNTRWDVIAVTTQA